MKDQANRYPIPPLTDDQRRAALDKAMRVRAERMQLKRDLKQGLVTARQASRCRTAAWMPHPE